MFSIEKYLCINLKSITPMLVGPHLLHEWLYQLMMCFLNADFLDFKCYFVCRAYYSEQLPLAKVLPCGTRYSAELTEGMQLMFCIDAQHIDTAKG